jgi:hypothetical protein
MEDAGPIVEILRQERLIEAVLVAKGSNVGRGCALAEHLQDGIAGNQVNEQKDQGDHQPYDRKSEEQAS